MKILIVCWVLLAAQCAGQRLTVYSPMTRFDPFGEIVPADRGPTRPREMLSPGIPRNAHSGFRIVVDVSSPEMYEVEVGMNPDDAVKLTLYREVFKETENGWYPDRLVPVSIPYRGTAADFSIPRQRAVTFWLDIWTPRDAPVDRIKVQPQLWTSSIDTWVLYPMEVRIQEPIVPDHKRTFAALPALGDRSDAYVRGVLNATLCNKPETLQPAPETLTVGDLIRREAVTALSLVRKSDTPTLALGWCTGDTPLAKAGPEWFLRFRDQIYRSAGATD
jgi:hypothetical protein